MAEFEDRLRQALRASAQEVRPDPRTWQRVESRIRRRQILSWAAPATAVAAVAAVAVLVVPQLQGGGDVELSPDEPDVAEDADHDTFAAEPPDGAQDEADPENGDDPAAESEPPRTLDDDDPDADGPEGDEDDEGQRITAFLVRSAGDRLWVEPATMRLQTSTMGVARASMEALMAAESDELETLAPEGTRVLGATISDDVLRVDLSEHVREGSAGAEAEQAFAQQLAHTAAQFDGVDAVEVLVGGEEIEELWGHLDWSGPIEPDGLALSPIVIEDAFVEEGAITVSGQATTYEATVELTLIGPDGEIVEETFTTADCGAPCRGPWAHTFDTAAESSGTWTVEAAAPQVTDEGDAPFQTTTEVAVD